MKKTFACKDMSENVLGSEWKATFSKMGAGCHDWREEEE